MSSADFVHDNKVYEVEVNHEDGWFIVYRHLPHKPEVILEGEYDGGPIVDCTNHLDESLCRAINERIIHLK
jgi:hypothetical protein